MNDSTKNFSDTNSRIKGQILRQVYRVWLFRKLLPVVILEVMVLAVILYQLGQAVFMQRILENALGVLFSNPGQIFSFVISAFVGAPLATKLLGFAVLAFIALLIRHLTQGILRLILVRENYFSRIQK